MAFGLSTSGNVIGPSPTIAADTEAQYPRLLQLEQPDPKGRRGWTGILGNTLLEMPWLIWSTFDLLLVTIGLYLGYQYFVWTPNGSWMDFNWTYTWLIHCPAFVLAGLVFGLYEQQTLLRRSRIVARSLLSITSAVILTYIVVSLCMYSVLSRRVLFLVGGFYMCTGPVARLLIGRCIDTYSRKFLIIGTDRKSRLSPDSHGDGLSKRYQLSGYISMDAVEVGRTIKDHKVLGTIDDLERICVEREIDEVVIGLGPAKNPRVLDKALGCLRLGCRVTNLSTFYEQVLSEVPLAHLEPHWFLFADFKHYREAQLIAKRALDIIGSLVGLALTLPFWPLIALLIKIDSNGPVFYHQRRVGLNGRIFRLSKFRTMVVSAEQNGHTWATPNDPRITRLGWYLRKTRIDELPQLWIILRGHMSIVGPRPERPEFVGELASQIRFYNERHLIKPGLTGWAQINYRYGASVNDTRRKLQLDLWYMKHMSIELDLVILLRTIGTVFLGSR